MTLVLLAIVKLRLVGRNPHGDRFRDNHHVDRSLRSDVDRQLAADNLACDQQELSPHERHGQNAVATRGQLEAQSDSTCAQPADVRTGSDTPASLSSVRQSSTDEAWSGEVA